MPNSKARDLASLLSGSGTGTIAPALVSDQENTSTGHFDVPAGTTAERPANPNVGYIRFNTTFNYLEQWTPNGWQTIAAPPQVNSISPTEALTGNTEITITGSNFESGSTVTFVGTSTSYQSPSVTVVSSNEIVAETPATPLTVEDAPYTIEVTSPTGLSGKLTSALEAGASPAWTTAASLGTLAGGSAVNKDLVATDADGQTVTYSSTDLPAELSLSSSGNLTGTTSAVTANTTKTFNVDATDGVNATNRTFSIVYARPSILVNGSGQFINSGYYIANEYGYYTIVPEQDMEVFIDMWGAGGGGGGGSNGPSRGSAGGESYGVVNLTAGTSYVLILGEGGYVGSSTTRSFPDGGYGNNNGYYAGGGGGSTRFGEYTQSGFNLTNSSSNYNNTNAVYYMIAGAGAGGNEYIYGYSGTVAGYGGGLEGAGGGAYYPSGESLNSTGKGGTQSAGGAAGTTPARLSQVSGATGAKYYGGNGSGSGGGGGYYGGGGARGYYSMGGGGSGFLNSSFVSNGAFATASAGQSTHYVPPNANGYNTSSSGQGGNNNGSRGTHGGFYIIGNGYR
jgi:hypothetical protein